MIKTLISILFLCIPYIALKDITVCWHSSGKVRIRVFKGRQ